MPELPEVETIKLGLQRKIIGLKIKKITVLNSKSFEGNEKLLEGKKILKIDRLAKVLRLDFDCKFSLLIHLKMSGQLIYQGKDKFIGGHPTLDMQGQMPNKSTRVIFEFSDEKSFSWQILKENLYKHRNLNIKVAILDQKIVSGIGNIYGCEALFLAKIHPQTRVKDLSDNQFKKLHQAIIDSLSSGIKHGGSSKVHFVNEAGKKGLFLDHAFVYARENLACKICKNKIQKIKLAGRGTYFCPNCQKS
ncbi:hypothetical protein HY025_01040 [Candidatus Daviesbacteria bacterium]|nr:hypothetical protein [Candidatus Daviesbacteria bacterium]